MANFFDLLARALDWDRQAIKTEGKDAEGDTASQNPVVMGVVDGSGNSRRVSLTYPVPTSPMINEVKDAGKVTDADGTDRTITPSDGFNYVAIVCDGPAELRICIDADSTAGQKIIYIKDGEVFEREIRGSVLHYSIAGDTCVFRHILQ